jgi:hypothetical protein
MLQHDVRVRRTPNQLQIVAGSDSQQEIPGWHHILVLVNNQFRCRVGDRSTVLRQPDIKFKTVTATTTMMHLRRELQIVGAVIGERDPRA